MKIISNMSDMVATKGVSLKWPGLCILDLHTCSAYLLLSGVFT